MPLRIVFRPQAEGETLHEEIRTIQERIQELIRRVTEKVKELVRVEDRGPQS